MEKDKLILSQYTLAELSKVIIQDLKEELLPLLALAKPPDESAANGITYMKRKEAAAILKISLPTLDLYTKTGKITAYRLSGKAIRYIESEVHAFLEKIKIHH